MTRFFTPSKPEITGRRRLDDQLDVLSKKTNCRKKKKQAETGRIRS